MQVNSINVMLDSKKSGMSFKSNENQNINLSRLMFNKNNNSFRDNELFDDARDILDINYIQYDEESDTDDTTDEKDIAYEMEDFESRDADIEKDVDSKLLSTATTAGLFSVGIAKFKNGELVKSAFRRLKI